MTTLRQKMINEMTLREFSPRTQEAYFAKRRHSGLTGTTLIYNTLLNKNINC